MYLDHYCLPNICNTSLQNIIISQLPQEKKSGSIHLNVYFFKNKVSLFYLNNYQQTHSKVPDKVGKEEKICISDLCLIISVFPHRAHAF